MAVSIQVVGVNNIVEVINTDTVKTIEVHPTEISPPGPPGPVGPKGDTGIGMPQSGVPVLATNFIKNPRFDFIPPQPYNSLNTVDLVSSPLLFGPRTARVMNPAGGYNRLGITDNVFDGALPSGTYKVRVHYYWPSTNLSTPERVRFQWTGAYAHVAIGTPDTWNMAEYTFTHNGAVGSLWFGIETSALHPSDKLYVSGFQLMKLDGALLSAPYFDGSTVGARWTGQPHSSTSELIMPDYRAIQDSSRMSGVGFPEGVVTAPVGTRYVDTAATNGAVEWIKTFGGPTTNTGWRVVYGDTGWRRVDAHADYGSGGRFLVRRVNETIYFANHTTPTFSTSLASGFIIWLPFQGFEPAVVSRGNWGPATSNVVGTVEIAYSAIRCWGMGIPAGNGTVYINIPPWITSSSWPTTLPGVAG